MINMDIVNGQISTNGTTPDNTSKDTKGTDNLGKDAFLQLLVAQLKNQDPLKPSSNEEFLAELAQFTSLEELQNLSTTLNNSNAFSLVGKNVVIQSGLSSGSDNVTEVGGYVEYVQLVDGKAQVSVGGQLYSADDVVTIIDDYYLSNEIGGGSDNSTGENGDVTDEGGNGETAENGDNTVTEGD